MYSGGIVVALGDVTVSDGSQIDDNTNRGPGGGIAANFLGTVTISGGSEVDDDTGAAIGGGIVNFSGPGGSVNLTGGSRVDGNTLTDAETLGQAIAVFLRFIGAQPNLAGNAALLQSAEHLLANPGRLVVGGGIGTLAAPISVSDGSEVSDNFGGLRVLPGRDNTIGQGGGIFSLLGRVSVDSSAVNDNLAPYGDGGGIYNVFNRLELDHATVDGNFAAGDGGGIWNRGILSSDSSTVSNNTSGNDGGGLFNARGGLAVIAHSVFTGNAAAHRGGGIANEGFLLVIDSIFADNTPNNISGR
jgi:hypothetical protein